MSSLLTARIEDRIPASADSTIVWFAILRRAQLIGDHQLQADARMKLKDLGVRVSFARNSDQRSTSTAAEVSGDESLPRDRDPLHANATMAEKTSGDGGRPVN